MSNDLEIWSPIGSIFATRVDAYFAVYQDRPLAISKAEQSLLDDLIAGDLVARCSSYSNWSRRGATEELQEYPLELDGSVPPSFWAKFNDAKRDRRTADWVLGNFAFKGFMLSPVAPELVSYWEGRLTGLSVLGGQSTQLRIAQQNSSSSPADYRQFIWSAAEAGMGAENTYRAWREMDPTGKRPRKTVNHDYKAARAEMGLPYRGRGRPPAFPT